MLQTNILSHIKKVLRIENIGKDIEPVLDSVDFYPNYYQLGDVYSSVFFLDSLPVNLYQEFLYNIINEFDLDMEIEVSEKDIHTVMNRAKERLATIEAEQQDVDKRGGMRSRLKEQEYQEVDDFINLLAEGVEKPFLFSFTV